MNATKITVQATVNADSKKAWECYTNPQHIMNWNFADPSWHCPSASNDLQIGGKYSARMEAKDGSFGFDFVCTYTQLTAGKSFTYQMEDGREASVTFTDNGTQTEVVVTFDAEEVNPVEMQQGGWQAILNNYKNYTEAL